MVAEQIKDKLEAILHPNIVLDKNRDFTIFSQYKERDLELFEEILLDSISAERESEITSEIASRFGRIANTYPTLLGSSNTLQAKVRTNLAFDLRLKGISSLSEVRKNLKHALFLKSHNELGFSATIGVGPTIEDPIYLVMINAHRDGADALRNELKEILPPQRDRDPLPKTLNGILDFIYSYSLVKSHLGPSEYLFSNLNLTNIKLTDKINRSQKLTDEQKTYWSNKINISIASMKRYVSTNDVSMWILTDAILENFVNIGNGITEHRDHWLVIDQGYSDKQFKNWQDQSRYTSEEALQRAFYGRLEFNVGQLFYSIFMDANISNSIKDMLEDRVQTMIYEGLFNKGTDTNSGSPRKGKQMPLPHNRKLSLSYFSLGMLSPAISYLAAKGEDDTAKQNANKLLDFVSNGTYIELNSLAEKFSAN